MPARARRKVGKLTQAISKFDEVWRNLAYRVAVGKLARPEDTPLPTREDVAKWVKALMKSDERQAGFDLARCGSRMDALAERCERNSYGWPNSDNDFDWQYYTLRLACFGIGAAHADYPAGFNAVLRLWKAADTTDLKHPLAILIESWLRRPREVKPSDTNVFPYIMAQKKQDNTGRYPLAAHFAQREGRKMVLPGFESEREASIYLPEELYRLAEREGARRGVVSRAQRALIYAMLRTPAEKAASPTGYWFPIPGKEYIAVTHRANKSVPPPREWLPALRGTRDILNTFDLPYIDANGKPRFFTPVAIMDYPLDAQDEIGFVTRLPEGYGGTGVSISPRLWEFTNRSHIFYLMLSAPFLYDQPGITWRPRKGGGVSHFRDVEAYPVLTRSMLANMANPFAAGRTRRELMQNAYDLVEEVARLTGAFQIAKCKDKRILLPPRNLVNLDKSAKVKGFEMVRYKG